MKTILENNKKKLISVMPQVKEYGNKLNYLTSWWDKVTLIGKINSYNLASLILEDMHKTKTKFSELHLTLIHNLLFEKFKKVIADSTAKSQVTIDILIRNLFERTADVGFLATDEDIRHFLSQPDNDEKSRLSIKNRLNEYIKKYSVYDEIVILDPNGKVQVNHDNNNRILVCTNNLVQETLSSKDDYVETFGFCDLQPNKANSLVYSCKITENNKANSTVIGILCLCFKFDDEMNSIFKSLEDNSDSYILLMSEKNKVISTNKPEIVPLNTRFTLSKEPQLITFKSKDYLVTTCQSDGYQGFHGLGWWAIVMTPLDSAFVQTDDSLRAINPESELNASTLFSNSLKEIYQSSKIINDDLSLVVLNGQITSLKQNSAEFMPVLEAIKQIGENTANIFSESLSDLQSTVLSSYMNDVAFMAALSVNIMDRNLYERANDCRWWALTSTFQRILTQPIINETDQAKLTDVLSYINSLYSVYTNLYLYDSNEKVIAVSNSEQGNFIGKQLNKSTGVSETLNLKNTQQYTVSPFIESPLYQDKKTYIYNAAITSNVSQKVVGGIGIVFDSEPEFRAILTDTLPKDERGKILNNCFAVFVERTGMVIAKTEKSLYNIGDTLKLPSHLFQIDSGNKLAVIHHIDEKEYIIGVAASAGYREYKTTGDYVNDILAFTFIPA